MYCPNCNSIISNDVKFCPNCGVQINANAQFNSNPAGFNSNQPNVNQPGQGADNNYNNNNAPYSAGNCGNSGAQNQYNNYNNPQFGNGYSNPYNNNPYQNNGGYPNPNYVNNQGVKDNKRSVGFCILSFFIPLLGLILYLVWKDNFPNKAKGCGIAAIIGVVCWFVSGVLRGIISALIGGSFYYDFDDVLDNYVNLASAFISRL